MRTYNIPIFVPHRGCPFDCVFCNQKRITGEEREVTKRTVKETIEKYLETLPNEECFIEAAFFGGSFTGIPVEEQTELLSAAYEFIKSGRIHGIRLSTRPDYISTDILENLVKYSVTTIELGVQSMDDGVLLESGRGHTSEDVKKAVSIIKKYPVKLGLQMMTGLPGDTKEKSIYTAKEIIKLKPQMVRIYPTLTIEDTELYTMYKEGTYKPQTLEEAVDTAKAILLMFEKENIAVIRIGLQSTEEICENGSVAAGPIHSAFGELVEGEIYYDLIMEKIRDLKDTQVRVTVNPKEISKAVGNKKRNIKRFKEERNITLKILGDNRLKKWEVHCKCC